MNYQTTCQGDCTTLGDFSHFLWFSFLFLFRVSVAGNKPKRSRCFGWCFPIQTEIVKNEFRTKIHFLLACVCVRMECHRRTWTSPTTERLHYRSPSSFNNFQRMHTFHSKRRNWIEFMNCVNIKCKSWQINRTFNRCFLSWIDQNLDVVNLNQNHIETNWINSNFKCQQNCHSPFCSLF